MTVANRATLRLLDKADKQIRKLDRSVKGALFDFQYKFRENPEQPGLNLERLAGSDLCSARLNDNYRVLLLHVGEQNYIIVAVKPHDVYRNLERYRDVYRYQVNPVSGGLEFIDLEIVESTLAKPASTPPLFAGHPPERLVALGVAEPLLPAVMRVRTEAELNELLAVVPQLTAEVLYELYLGADPERIAERVTAPATAGEPVDTSDLGSAAGRPATAVTDDVDLRSVIDDPFADWRVYLHPSQRRVVERTYRGPVRVSGGPGTGKTVVALHRVRHLAERLPPADGSTGGRILLTTFNTNLAADLRYRLGRLGAFDDRVDVVNIDKLAGQVVAESSGDGPRRMLSDPDAIRQWEKLLAELDETEFTPRFVHEEWTQVILGQAINDRTAYFRARRAGRGAKLGRAQRARVWELVERFTQRLDERGQGTFAQIAEQAARLEIERAGAGRHRYRHVVVDEAQDLSAAHWKMLRAMAAEQPDDLFLTGDPHQRIYQHRVSLGSLGINIRGRSARLSVSYRTTRQILRTAVAVLGAETFDDLDDGIDDLRGYRSLLHGPVPELRGTDDQAAEFDLVVRRAAAWAEDEPSAVGVCVPERWMVEELVRRLNADGVPAQRIRASGTGDTEAVHVGTMHRFKGLEYRRMIIAGVNAATLPPGRLDAHRDADPAYYRTERRRYRSLLFVAATRARDDLLICWNGTPSPFLPERLARD